MTPAYLHPASVGGRAYLAPLAAPAGTTSVSSDLDVSYLVRASVACDLPAAYAVRGGVAADLAVSYAVLAAAALAHVSSDLSVAYAVRAVASTDLAVTYAIRASVAADLSPSYAVRASIIKDMTMTYSILAATGCADTNIWRGSVPKPQTYTVGDITATVESAFTLRGGLPTADMDPDDFEHYGVSVVDILAVLPGVTIDDILPLTQGVTVPSGELVTRAGTDLYVLLSGADLSEDDANFVTFRMKLSNKEQRDRTIYFRKVSK